MTFAWRLSAVDVFMLNRLWLSFFFASFAAALWLWLGQGDTAVFTRLVQALFDMARLSVEVAIALVGTLTLWLGFLKVAENGGLVRGLSRLLGRHPPPPPDRRRAPAPPAGRHRPRRLRRRPPRRAGPAVRVHGRLVGVVRPRPSHHPALRRRPTTTGWSTSPPPAHYPSIPWWSAPDRRGSWPPTCWRATAASR